MKFTETENRLKVTSGSGGKGLKSYGYRISMLGDKKVLAIDMVMVA